MTSIYGSEDAEYIKPCSICWVPSGTLDSGVCLICRDNLEYLAIADAGDAAEDTECCPIRYRIIVEASGTLGGMHDELKAHGLIGCVFCGMRKGAAAETAGGKRAAA